MIKNPFRRGSLQLFHYYFSLVVYGCLGENIIYSAQVIDTHERTAIPLVTLKPYGFVGLRVYSNTRQVIGSAELESALLPSPEKLDIFGHDIKAHPNGHMSAIETRLGVDLEGPCTEDFKTEGRIEADFLGPRGTPIDLDSNSLGMRHAYWQIVWDDMKLMFGQFWHPLVVPESWPEVLSYNGGAPIEIVSRTPQIRFTKRWDDFELITAVTVQRDFPSPGPEGSSTIYARNAVIPELHLQARWYYKTHLFGWALNYKRLVPRLKTEKRIKTDEHVDSFVTEAYATVHVTPQLSVRAKAIYAQNGADLSLIGGYGVASINSVTDERTYTPLTATSMWLDVSYAFKDPRFQTGAFLGYIKNVGSREPLFIDRKTGKPIIYSFLDVTQNIDYTMRIAPRISFLESPIFIGFEIQYTQTGWGNPQRNGKVAHSQTTGNTRFLLIFNYLF